MRRFMLLAAVVVAALSIGFSGTAFAAGIKAEPGVYDPDATGCVSAAWIGQAGLADTTANGSQGLVLTKDCPTSTNAAAGASITGVEGLEVTALSFDFRSDSLCTSGSPRFNLVASDGFHFVGGCGNGTITDGPEDGWSTVTFDLQNDAFPAIDPGATIVSLTLLLDEQGTAVVDNITVNGTVIERAGNVK